MAALGPTHPGDIRTHPWEDCGVCQELGPWDACEDTLEWINRHREGASGVVISPECPGCRAGLHDQHQHDYMDADGLVSLCRCPECRGGQS